MPRIAIFRLCLPKYSSSRRCSQLQHVPIVVTRVIDTQWNAHSEA